jgi:hypothetical protein
MAKLRKKTSDPAEASAPEPTGVVYISATRPAESRITKLPHENGSLG